MNSFMVIASAGMGCLIMIASAFGVLAMSGSEPVHWWVYLGVVCAPFFTYVCALIHAEYATRSLDRI